VSAFSFFLSIGYRTKNKSGIFYFTGILHKMQEERRGNFLLFTDSGEEGQKNTLVQSDKGAGEKAA